MLGSTLKSYLFAQPTHPIEVALTFSSPAQIMEHLSSMLDARIAGLPRLSIITLTPVPPADSLCSSARRGNQTKFCTTAPRSRAPSSASLKTQNLRQGK